MATKLDVFPGSEFRAAYQEATACGAKVVLGDRDIEVNVTKLSTAFVVIVVVLRGLQQCKVQLISFLQSIVM